MRPKKAEYEASLATDSISTHTTQCPWLTTRAAPTHLVPQRLPRITQLAVTGRCGPPATPAVHILYSAHFVGMCADTIPAPWHTASAWSRVHTQCMHRLPHAAVVGLQHRTGTTQSPTHGCVHNGMHTPRCPLPSAPPSPGPPDVQRQHAPQVHHLLQHVSRHLQLLLAAHLTRDDVMTQQIMSQSHTYTIRYAVDGSCYHWQRVSRWSGQSPAAGKEGSWGVGGSIWEVLLWGTTRPAQHRPHPHTARQPRQAAAQAIASQRHGMMLNPALPAPAPASDPTL